MRDKDPFPRHGRAAERHFQRLAGPINVSVDLKYDALCTACPLESVEVVMAGI